MLKNLLNEILQELPKDVNFNCGGCGLFAYKVASTIDIKQYTYIHQHLNNVKKHQIVSRQQLIVPNHVMVKIDDNTLFDSNGFHTLEEMFKKKYYVKNTPKILKPNFIVNDNFDALYEIDKDYLVELLNVITFPGWNTEFKTSVIHHLDEIIFTKVGRRPEPYYKMDKFDY